MNDVCNVYTWAAPERWACRSFVRAFAQISSFFNNAQARNNARRLVLVLPLSPRYCFFFFFFLTVEVFAKPYIRIFSHWRLLRLTRCGDFACMVNWGRGSTKEPGADGGSNPKAHKPHKAHKPKSSFNTTMFLRSRMLLLPFPWARPNANPSWF